MLEKQAAAAAEARKPEETGETPLLTSGGHRSDDVASEDGIGRQGIGLVGAGRQETGRTRANDTWLAALAESSALSAFTTGLVLLNMVLMCLPYVGMSEEYAAQLEQAASTITWIFIVEMAIKLFGLGCARYWSDRWNCLDGTIVSLSILEMVMTALFAGSGVKLAFLRMLRMLRVLRVLRLMRSWKGLYNIITTFIKTIPAMSNLVVLILLTMFVFALLGMQVSARQPPARPELPAPMMPPLTSPTLVGPFASPLLLLLSLLTTPQLGTQLLGGIFGPSHGYALEPCPPSGCTGGLLEKPRQHFDFCAPAMLTVFIVLTGEWVDAMEPAAAVEGAAIALFYIAIVVLGKVRRLPCALCRPSSSRRCSLPSSHILCSYTPRSHASPSSSIAS